MQLTEQMVARFYDEEHQLFFDVADDHEKLITRPRDVTDNAMPSGSSLAAELLARLAVMCDRPEWEKLATTVLNSVGDALVKHPHAFGQLLGVADMLTHGAVEVAIVGPDRTQFVAAATSVFAPSLVLASVDGTHAESSALTRGRGSDSERTLAYVCRRFVCDSPTDNPRTLRGQVAAASKAS